jgi:hypothetical protein
MSSRTLDLEDVFKFLTLATTLEEENRIEAATKVRLESIVVCESHQRTPYGVRLAVCLADCECILRSNLTVRHFANFVFCGFTFTPASSLPPLS